VVFVADSTISENGVLAVLARRASPTSAAACSAACRSPPLEMAAYAAFTAAEFATAVTTFWITKGLALALVAALTAEVAIRLACAGKAVMAAPTMALEIAGAIVSEPRVVATFTPEAVKSPTWAGAEVTAEATAARVTICDKATGAVSFLAAMVVVATTPPITLGARLGDWVRIAETTSETTLGATKGSARVMTTADTILATCWV